MLSCSETFSFSDLARDADVTLFSSMLKKQHCLHSILPDTETITLYLRRTGHIYELPTCSLESYHFVSTSLFAVM